MRKFENLSGRDFGELHVLERTVDYVSPAGHKLIQYKCKCSCGVVCTVRAPELKNGKVTACHTCTCRRTFDIIGQRFGYLTVLSRTDDYYIKSIHKKVARYLCQCDCGRLTKVITGKLTSGLTRSCGKCGKFSNFHDLTGQRFDKLVVLRFDSWYNYPNGNRDARWLCRCDCGNELVVRGTSLKSQNFGHKCWACRQKYFSENGQMSSFERFVFDFLVELGFDFEYQHGYADLKHGSFYLLYDFCVFLNGIEFLIECHGAQHYTPVSVFGGEAGFKKLHANDIEKKEYAKSHGHPLLELNCSKSIPVNYKTLILDFLDNSASND